jgi:hypothetical protein
MSTYQLRYVYYAKVRGIRVEDLFKKDGNNTRYINWILGKWKIFDEINKSTPEERGIYHDKFDAWLVTVVDEELKGGI